jgi:heme-degrading monooxygenase HmoA
MIANTPLPPYFAVIFTSVRTSVHDGYDDMSELMIALSKVQEGFLGVESARNDTGITVSYWKDLKSVKKWKENVRHSDAQIKGRTHWYKNYKVRIAKVERDYYY